MTMKCPPPIPADWAFIRPLHRPDAMAASTAEPPFSIIFLNIGIYTPTDLIIIIMTQIMKFNYLPTIEQCSLSTDIE